MKSNSLNVTAILVLLLSSCSTVRVSYSGKKIAPIKSIVLYSTMIGKIQQPIFPLIDAGLFNEKTNSIADQIMDLQNKKVENYRTICTNSLKKHFNCIVFSDTLLRYLPEYSELGNTFNYQKQLRIDNDHFPKILISSNDVNPFQFDNGNVPKYFSDNKNYKSIIIEICNKLKMDIVAVSYSQLSVVGVGIFGAWGYLRLDSFIYLFDKDGVLVSHGQTWSKATNISGKDIEQYKNQLDVLPFIIEPLLLKVSSNFK